MTSFISEPNATTEELAVAPDRAAKLAGVGRTTIYEAIGRQELKSLKVGKRRLIRIEALRAWLANLESEGRDDV